MKWELNKADFNIESIDLKIEKCLDLVDEIDALIKSSKDVISVLGEYSDLSKEINELFAFIQLSESINIEDQMAVSAKTKADKIIEKITILYSRITKYIVGNIHAESPELEDKDFGYLIKRVLQDEKYQLDEKTEGITSSLDSIYSESLLSLMNIIDSKLSVVIDNNELNLTELRNNFSNTDTNIRRDSYKEYLKYVENNKVAYFNIYSTLVRATTYENNLRGITENINTMHLQNDISAEVINSMLEVTKENKTIFVDYFDQIAESSKIKDYSRFDIYVDDSNLDTLKLDIDEANDIVLEQFEKFSPKFKQLAKKIIDAKHVDSSVSKNKEGGAYCLSYRNDKIPYVFINYQKSIRDVYTVAHEYGHGVHFLLSEKIDQLSYNPELILAETASIFSEILTIHGLIRKFPELKAGLISNKIGDLYATIIRQANIVEFEIEAHRLIPEGATVNELSDKYLEIIRSDFSDKINVDDGFKNEWMYISHIYQSPFYCYSYTFGALLALVLYRMYENKDIEANDIEEIFSVGGSMSTTDNLARFDIDISTRDFWQQGFDVIKDLLNTI